MEASRLWMYKEKLSSTHKLIHCITNPISMNDCANAVLAIGAKVIMAQHPAECAQITEHSSALAVNLGNFDDKRAEAMQLSGRTAKENRIPIILDVVGVGCSDLRKQYALTYCHTIRPDVIKGNISELKAMTQHHAHAQGVDAGMQDKEEPRISSIWLRELANTLQCIVLCSGEVDIITDGKETVYIQNGCSILPLITGTGCMLGVICASFMSVCSPFESAVLACAYEGIAAECTYRITQSPGTFHMHLLDQLFQLDQHTFDSNIKLIHDKGEDFV